MLPANFHHLYYFWVTAKQGSIAKAKDKLLLAQPTLSLQIKQLEKFFGKKLFIRRHEGLLLTPEGLRAFEHCELMFTQGESLLRDMKQQASAPNRNIRIGATKTISREIILRVLNRIEDFQGSSPATIFSGDASELCQRLNTHTLDLAISNVDFSNSPGQNFIGRLWEEIPAYFVAAPALKRRLGRFPRKNQAIGTLVRTPEHPVRKATEDYIRRHRLAATIVAETDDSDLIRILAIQGKGVAVLNSLAVREDIAQGRLAKLSARPSGIEYIWLISSARNEVGSSLQQHLC